PLHTRAGRSQGMQLVLQGSANCPRRSGEGFSGHHAAAVFARRHAMLFVERASEMRRAVETPGKGDLGQGVARPARIADLLGTFFQSAADGVGRYLLASTGKDG